MGSNYTRKVLKNIDWQFENTLPRFLYTVVVIRLKNFLSSLLGVQELSKIEKETAGKLGGSDVKRSKNPK